jgi:hypothetical protein
MSLVFKLIIGGWSTAFAMFGLLALHESGKLRQVRTRIKLWVARREVPAAEGGLQPDRDGAA